jgi:hypothetical protein
MNSIMITIIKEPKKVEKIEIKIKIHEHTHSETQDLHDAVLHGEKYEWEWGDVDNFTMGVRSLVRFVSLARER